MADTGCRPWGRNASENPAGIETMQFVKEKVANEKGRNASENPAGIETYIHY